MKRSFIFISALLGLLSLEAQYISEVLEYRPGPGQFINDATWGTPHAAGSLVGGTDGHLSLGAFGGYVVFRFAEPVENHPDNPYGVDFTIFGNPMSEWSEPAVVWVMPDENGNNLPDEQWFELAGSDYPFSSSRQARVRYENPGGNGAADVGWEDELGNSGFIRANSVHKQSYYPANDSFPDLPAASYVLEGSLVRGRIDLIHPPMIKSLKRAFGYADNQARGSGLHTLPDNPYTPEAEHSGGDAFDISWAVDSSGSYVALEEILFVKVQSAILHEGGYLGELSTEITGAVDVEPDPSAEGGPDRLLVLADLPVESAGDTLQLEVFCFEKGKLVDLPPLEWSISVDWARVDEEHRLIMDGEGELSLLVRAGTEPELEASSETRVRAEDPVLSSAKTRMAETAFYPNPARDRIFFNVRAQVEVFALSGAPVKSGVLVAEGGNLDCSDLAPGVYMILLKTDHGQKRHQLVIH